MEGFSFTEHWGHTNWQGVAHDCTPHELASALAAVIGTVVHGVEVSDLAELEVVIARTKATIARERVPNDWAVSLR